MSYAHSPVTLASLFRPELRDLTAYVPEVPDWIEVRLDANEAPPNPSPRIREVIADAVSKTALEKYLDARAGALREAIAKRTGANAADLLVGTAER